MSLLFYFDDILEFVMETKTIKNSIYGKNFRIYDLFLKSILFSSFFMVSSFFIYFLFYIFKNGVSHLNFKLISNVVDGVEKGILPVIVNTIYIVFLTLLISTPIGIGCAIYLTQYEKNQKIFNIVSFLTNTLASIPSILIGLFGYTFFCIGFGLGSSILAGCLTVSLTVLPNIIETAKESLLNVPSSYKKGALALGASKFKVIFNLILPSAMPGILTAIILSAGKIIGESASLLLTVGTANKLPKNILTHIFKSGKTLTLHLYFTAGNGNSRDSINICFAVAIILIFFSFLLNCLTKVIGHFAKNKS